MAGAALGLGCALLSRVPALASGARQRNLAWVWQFEEDGHPAAIRAVLAAHGLGIKLKTHDGATWMGRWAKSPIPILGAGEIGPYAQFFESAGVPFHAWCVVEGIEPIREAHMCAEVLSAGARSLTFDLEPREGQNYWQGDSAGALEFGRELRRLAPNAWLSVSPDPRPWQLEYVPIAEFASFCDEIAPQTYWRTFDSPANHRFLAERGYPVGPEGVTPEHLLNVTKFSLQRFGLPIRPVGQGNADADAWSRFLRHSTTLGMDSVSVWRFGTATPDVFQALRLRQTPEPVPPARVSPPQRRGVWPPRSPEPESEAETVRGSSEIASPTRTDDSTAGRALPEEAAAGAENASNGSAAREEAKEERPGAGPLSQFLERNLRESTWPRPGKGNW